MPIIILILVVLVILYGPQLWVGRTLRRYQEQRDDLDGTGGELARHLLDINGLQDVDVTITTDGDHYDPSTRIVALSEENFNGKSITAVAVAAHETGHALQHADGYRPLMLRSKLAVFAYYAEKLGIALVFLVPIFGMITGSAGIARLFIGGVLISFLSSIVVHIVTLPVEFNASFSRALPILEKGEYLDAEDMKPARKILLAAALTYVSASLMSILNFGRWLMIFRR
ncbi:probable metal-dependent peptidase [hydrothermal vent metagenome]|uniref:Probable metal-dependent peptidase n=1 Tax=hydrothermal vent metagenome TaxID=652676 RepID=A0A3B0YL38_9ZZZZ